MKNKLFTSAFGVRLALSESRAKWLQCLNHERRGIRRRKTTASPVSAYSACSAVSFQAVWFWLNQVRVSVFFGAALVLAALTAGCSMLKPAQSETTYYLLTPAPPVTATSHTSTAARAWVVRVRPVELADYLNTKDIAVRTGPNQIRFALFHRWAEPLDSGIRQVIAANLRSAPLLRQVLTDEPAPEGFPVYTLSVRVLACEGVSTNEVGYTTFEAVWELAGSGPNRSILDHGVFRARPVPWFTGDYAGLAAQLSQSLADFTHVLLTALARHPAD